MSRSGAAVPDAAAMPQACTSRAVDAQDAQQLYASLNEYLQLECKFQPRLCLPQDSEEAEVSTGARDGAAHVMRCLKVWFDLPPEILFHSINLFDRFLTRMRVRPCHVPCITVSCVNIAIEEYAAEKREQRKVSVEELVSISQSACTSRDVVRMSRVIEDKLSLCRGAAPAITSLQWLRLFNAVFSACDLPDAQESTLVNSLEIVSCDYSCANLRSCEIALVLLHHQLSASVSSYPEDISYRVLELLNALQALCGISDADALNARRLAVRVVGRYEQRTRAAAPPQRLVWRLSERTLRALRPTERLTRVLPTIQETLPPAPAPHRSDECEETSSWPRSPVLPVYCDQ